MRTNRQRVEDRGSAAVVVLERAWSMLRQLDPRIPKAVVVLLAAGARELARGHFARSSWKARGKHQAHEIALSPHLFSAPEQLLVTMLHEAAHATLWEEGEVDGGVTGQYYHRITFRNRCWEYGLACEFLNTRYGFTLTAWPKRNPVWNAGYPRWERAAYVPILEHLRKSLPAGSSAQIRGHGRGRKLPISGQVRLTCPCDRHIYAPRSVAEGAAIICSLCGYAFMATP